MQNTQTGKGFQGKGFQGKSFQGKGFQGKGFQGKRVPKGYQQDSQNGFHGNDFQGKGFQGNDFQGKGFQENNFQGKGFQGKGFQENNFQGNDFQGKGFQGKGFQGNGKGFQQGNKSNKLPDVVNAILMGATMRSETYDLLKHTCTYDLPEAIKSAEKIALAYGQTIGSVVGYDTMLYSRAKNENTKLLAPIMIALYKRQIERWEAFADSPNGNESLILGEEVVGGEVGGEVGEEAEEAEEIEEVEGEAEEVGEAEAEEAEW